MRLNFAAFALFPVLLGPVPQNPPDFSGRWVLAVPAEAISRETQSVTVAAAGELIVRQTTTSITVEHPKPGTHPMAGTHEFKLHGVVDKAGEQRRWAVFWFGDQLVVGTGITGAPDADGRQQNFEHSEMWSLDGSGRLVIDCVERQPGARPKRATLTYVKR